MQFNLEMRPKVRKLDSLAKRSKILWAEPKFDGYRLTIVKDISGTISAYGRKPDRDLWPKLKYQFDEQLFQTPKGTIYDGELFLANQPATEVVTTYLAEKPILFCCFAVPFWNGIDIRRTASHETRDRICECFNFIKPEVVPLEKATKTEAQRLHLEGFVFKERHYSGWWKEKPQETIDAFVIGVLPGLGKFHGQNGALQVAIYEHGRLVEIASVGKGRDDQWRRLSESKLLGRVLEISHEGVQAQGKLKFSSFLRWRDDKSKEECTFEGQLP